jgi:hypothetical protein
VQSSAKLLHARIPPSLLLKVDIARASNSVAWLFLEVLRKMGFPMAWLDWVPVLLSTANTRILLNGNLGHRNLSHKRSVTRRSLVAYVISLHGDAQWFDQEKL